MPSFAPNPLRALAGSDPGRVRLVNATAVACTVLLSTGAARLITALTHSSSDLIVVGAFLAMIGGLSVKDPTSHRRLTTTAILVAPAAATLTVMVLLDHWRYAAIAVLVAVCTGATWIRRFGPRWTAVGMVAFISAFFGLVIEPTIGELGPLLAIVVASTGCGVLVRLVMLSTFPRRSLRLLLREFRRACAVGLTTAVSSPDRSELQKTLDRIADVAMAIHDWQAEHDTRLQTGMTKAELARLLFDARTDMTQTCLQVAQAPSAADHTLIAALHATLASAPTGVPPRAPLDLADHVLTETGDDTGFVGAVVARAIVSASALQHAVNAGIAHGDHVPETPAPAIPAPSTSHEAPSARRFWERWEPTTRMAVQVAIATALATLVGEAISASRWYWAVLTAFLVFVGTTTRGAILTRAYRRVLGTVLGVVAGFAITWIADGNSALLALSCVVCVFFIVYLGPLNYAFLAFFVTALIASMYGLMGVLNREVLEWRVEETAAGALIGIASAFLIFSTSSRPALVQKIEMYFDALDDLLARTATALAGGPTEPVVDAVSALDARHDELQAFVTAMWVSLADSDMRRVRRSATDLINTAGVQVQRMAQESISLHDRSAGFTGDGAVAVATGIDIVREQARTACECLVRRPRSQDAPAAPTAVLDPVKQIAVDGTSPRFQVLLTMSKLSVSLQRISRLRDGR